MCPALSWHTLCVLPYRRCPSPPAQLLCILCTHACYAPTRLLVDHVHSLAPSCLRTRGFPLHVMFSALIPQPLCHHPLCLLSLRRRPSQATSAACITCTHVRPAPRVLLVFYMRSFITGSHPCTICWPFQYASTSRTKSLLLIANMYADGGAQHGAMIPLYRPHT